MFQDFIRILYSLALFYFRFVGTGLGIARLIQRKQMGRLADQAASIGFSKATFSDKRDKAELSGTFSGIPIRVKIQFDGSSRTGTFVSATLKGNPRRLQLENGWFRYLITSFAYKGSYYPRFTTGNKGFDSIFPHRFADKQTARTLTESKELLNAISRFYTYWLLSIDSVTLNNIEEKTTITFRFNYGYYFFPYIRPEILREIVNGLVTIAALWNKGFGNRLSDEEKSLANRLLKSAEKGDAVKVARLLKQGARVDFMNNDYETALHCGAGSHNIEVVRILLKAGANPNAQDRSYNTPLHRIIACPTDPAMLSLLIDNGADVNITNSQGETVLFWPARWDDVPIVKALINHGINVMVKNEDGETALDVADPGTESYRLMKEAGDFQEIKKVQD